MSEKHDFSTQILTIEDHIDAYFIRIRMHQIVEDFSNNDICNYRELKSMTTLLQMLFDLLPRRLVELEYSRFNGRSKEIKHLKVLTRVDRLYILRTRDAIMKIIGMLNINWSNKEQFRTLIRFLVLVSPLTQYDSFITNFAKIFTLDYASNHIVSKFE